MFKINRALKTAGVPHWSQDNAEDFDKGFYPWRVIFFPPVLHLKIIFKNIASGLQEHHREAIQPAARKGGEKITIHKQKCFHLLKCSGGLKPSGIQVGR